MPTIEQKNERLTRSNATLREQLRTQEDVSNMASDARAGRALNQGRAEGGVAGAAGGLILGAVLLFGSGALGKGGPDASPTPEPSLRPGATLTLPPTEAPSLTAAPTATAVPTEEAPSASPTAAPTDSESHAPIEGLGEVIGAGVPVPSTVSEVPAMGLEGGAVASDGTVHPEFTEGQWFHPVYDEFASDADHDWRGIGPWYPVSYSNLDENAATLTSHGNVGELVVRSERGGWVQVNFWQLDNHQDDGSWGRNGNSGRLVHNPDWDMQYNLHGLNPDAELRMVDPDTGRALLWPDGSPVIYRSNSEGIAAFAVPETNGNDVRWGIQFRMPTPEEGVQYSEVKIERGPNDLPELEGENPLPDTIIRPEVPLE